MCEYCDRLTKAYESGNMREIDSAECDWWREKLGDGAATVRAVASNARIDDRKDLFERQSTAAGECAAAWMDYFTSMLVDTNPLIILDERVLATLHQMILVMSRLFWYGILSGGVNDIAKQILGGVPNEPQQE